MLNSNLRRLCLGGLAATLLLVADGVRADALADGFGHPPDSAKPQIWWHWMNGNITREGITLDLEAMKRVGIGGAQIFNVDCDIPAGPVKLLSPEWRGLMHHAVEEADRLGLELCIHNGAGWSSSGGPWNTPENAMQRVTTSERQVKGPMHFSGVLTQPPTKLNYYRDIAVQAFRATPGGNPTVVRHSPRTAANFIPTAEALRPLLTITNLEAKGAFNGDFVDFSPPETAAVAGRVVSHSRIIDLTAKMAPDGRLDWDVPSGDWTILRIGYTPTGEINHPAPAEGAGLECDKFSKEALDAHWAGYVQKVLDDAGPLAGHGKALDNVLIDSYEVGGQNWSPRFRDEFTRRRGYDPAPYLPALAGKVVDSPEISERFLWDMRRTVADLFADNYYGHFQELCHEHGLKASFEPYTGPFDSLQCGARADIPMGEFWAGSEPDQSVKLASSIGHIYGQPIIGAESFTGAPARTHGRWLDDPYSLKMLGDLVFCQGVNRYIFHRYAMQPWTNRLPGMTMGQWGTHFDRTSTWWEQSRAWLQYVARCQFLLQQGRYVADAAYFCGENAPSELRAGHPDMPAGYSWDAIDADVLLHHATVKNGSLSLDTGLTYRLLILPSSDRDMRPDLLRQLRQFVADGLTLVGPSPQISPSLQDYPRCDAEVKKLTAEMWADCDGVRVTRHPLGQGAVYWGQPLERVCAKVGLEPDFDFAASGGTKLAFIHRRDGKTDLYFVSNQRQRAETIDCSFRVAGKTPELWNPATGSMMPAPIWREQEGRTIVSLALDPAGSVFVVFREKAGDDHLVAIEGDLKAPPLPVSTHSELRVIHAEYGSFQDAHQVDVTAKVKSIIASGATEIPASNDMAEEDPAENIVKHLRLVYLDHGQKKTAIIQEGESFAWPAGGEILEAVYGDLAANPKPNRTMDVTAKLAGMIHDGRLTLRVNNALSGGDLAALVPKSLHLEYAVKDEVKHIVVGENETLSLPEDSAFSGAPREFEFVPGAKGNARLLSWEPGKFNFTWASGRKTSWDCSPASAPVVVEGPWQLDFPPGWNAPASVTLTNLESWTLNGDPGVKYFSGTATYRKEIEIPADWPKENHEIWMNLGKIKNIAEVFVNGQSLGILWKPPFRVNLTAVARPGANTVEIKVTNLWPNRLIGDEQLPPDCEWSGLRLKNWPQWLLDGKPSPTGRLTFTTWHHWKKDDALLPSGLLGPVTLQVADAFDLQ